jgi:hypothetical protein
MKMYGEVDVEIHIFLTSVLVGDVISFKPRQLYRQGKRPGTTWTGSWVDPRARLDEVEKRIFLTLPGLELLTPQSPNP